VVLALAVYYAILDTILHELFFIDSTLWKTAAMVLILALPIPVALRCRSLRSIGFSIACSMALVFALFTLFPERADQPPPRRTQPAPGTPAAAFERAGRQRDRSLAISAIRKLQEGGDEATVIAAVQYLRKISGRQIGNDPDRWTSVFSKVQKIQAVTGNENEEDGTRHFLERGYSGVKLASAFDVAGQTGADFVRTYIQVYLPDQITSEDIEFLIQLRAKKMRPGESTASSRFREGSTCLMLAIAESIALTQGSPIPANKIDSDWLQASALLRSSGPLGAPMSAAVDRILEEADLNHDSHRDAGELQQLILKRE
ncbi:MAG TPA: hypothetical protein VLR94_00840, partial [Acidobacteriota bacterium]|nr:hypothetical protein [Acidobacteriota bacterium]